VGDGKIGKEVTKMTKMAKYSEEFKQSIVNLYRGGKPAGEILNEYGVASSAFYRWAKKYSVVQISETESMTMIEIKAMQKRLAQLEEENMILKKTISIFTRE
jgi:transposase